MKSDKRKGVRAGERRLGPVNKFLFRVAIVSTILAIWGWGDSFLTHSELKNIGSQLTETNIELMDITRQLAKAKEEIQQYEKVTKTWGTFNFPTESKEKPVFWKGMMSNPLAFRNDEWGTYDKWDAWPENGKINLTGTVRDGDGQIVFQIIKTKWKNWTGKDFNYDNRAIEVKDSMGHIIFQLEFDKKKNEIHSYGIFYYGHNQLFLGGKNITKTVILNSPSANAYILLLIESMKPIFKYPREEHLGERV